MSSIRKYGFINAKVRAMRSFLLTESLYRSMVASRDIKEIFSLLSQTRFRRAVERLESPNAIAMERELFLEEIYQLRAIEKFCSGDVHKFFLLLLERYDGEKLKILLRMWHRKCEEDQMVIREKIVYDIPVDAIISSENLSEIVELLTDTPFRRVLDTTSELYRERKTLFPLELAIDRDIFRRLWESIESLNRRDRQIVRRFVGIEIDLKNLDWISRYREYYKLSPSEITELLLPHGYRLDSKEIRDVVAGRSVVEALKDVGKGMQVPFSEDREGVLVLDALERFIYQVLLSEAKRAFGEFPFSIGAILGYFYLMRIETKNILSLLQAKEYQLSPQQTEAFLVL